MAAPVVKTHIMKTLNSKTTVSKTPVLKTKRFVIRAFKEADLKTFAQYRSEPEIARYQSWENYSYQKALSLFHGIDYSNFGMIDQWYQLAITDAVSDQLLGDLAVHFIDREQVEIGFTVAPDNQNKGVAREAVSGLLDYLFNSLNKHRVIAITDTQNVASCRLLESLGFRKEAHFRQNIFFKGSWGDEYLYAMLKFEHKD